jgi:hypothetical protein
MELESITAVSLMTVPPWSEDAGWRDLYFRELRGSRRMGRQILA